MATTTEPTTTSTEERARAARVAGAASDKLCCTCGQRYPATPENFTRDNRSPDGWWRECKTCANAYQAVWRLTKELDKNTAASHADPEYAHGAGAERATVLLARLTSAQELLAQRKAMGDKAAQEHGYTVERGRRRIARGPAATEPQAEPVPDEVAAGGKPHREELEAAVEAAGGPGTDQGQQLLADAAEQAKAARRAADAERKRRERAAKKAAAQAAQG